MPDVRLPELSLAGRVGVSYVDAPMNCLADLSVKPVTYNPPPGTGLPRREGNYQNFVVRIHNARPYADDLSLDRQAFILTTHDTQVRDFYDADDQWHYFPAMTREEAILIKCYDSMKDGRARFSLHSAFDDPTTSANARPRQSIEVRTLAFFD